MLYSDILENIKSWLENIKIRKLKLILQILKVLKVERILGDSQIYVLKYVNHTFGMVLK